MAVASARMTLGTVLGTLSTAANTVTNVLDAASASIGMANAYVNNAANQQKKRILKDSSTFDERLIEEHGQETALRQVEIMKFCGQSAQHAKFYNDAAEKMREILAAAA